MARHFIGVFCGWHLPVLHGWTGLIIVVLVLSESLCCNMLPSCCYLVFVLTCFALSCRWCSCSRMVTRAGPWHMPLPWTIFLLEGKQVCGHGMCCCVWVSAGVGWVAEARLTCPE